jgi:hypothetical protein
MKAHPGRRGYPDMVGKTYGLLTVLDRLDRAPLTSRGQYNKARFYVCRCVCGTVKPMQGDLLRRGTSRSCGCRRGQKYP